MKLTRFKLAFLSYALFDLLIGGHCGGLLPLGSMAAAQQGQAVGNITSAATTCSTTAVPTNCVILQLDAASGAASIDISGTWAATLQIEAFGGVTWAAINCTPPNSTTAVSSTTANGVWQCNVAGFSSIRVRASAYTSGTAAVVINSAHASAKSSGGGAVFSSGGTTVNVLCKSDGSSKCSDSSVTDNGTTVSTTEAVALPDVPSGAGNPSLRGATAANGVYLNGTIAGLVSSSTTWIATNTTTGGVQLPAGGMLGWSSNNTIGGVGSDTFIRRRTTGSFTLGTTDVNGVPVAQTVGVQNAVTGTDLAGSKWTFDAPLGTGAGAGASTAINRAQILSTGTTAQTGANALVVCESKILSNTSATAQTLANIALASNSAGGASGTITVTATDGTNFDSETQSFNVSYVNKATVGTVGTPAITASTAANNSGSATIGMTATFSGTTLSIKVTPVFTTIVPTVVTSYIELNNHGAGAVTCQ